MSVLAVTQLTVFQDGAKMVLAEPNSPEQRNWRAWERAVADFTASLGSAGLSESTLRRVKGHLRSYAHATPELGPWDATPASLNEWIPAAAGRSSWPARRSSLRTFYRWATRTGRMLHDPMAPISGRLRPAEIKRPGWREPVEDWLFWLRSAGFSAESIRLRRHHLTRLANDLDTADPWMVTTRHLVVWIGRHDWQRETARTVRSSVRSFYAWAVDTEQLSASPALKVPAIRATAGTRRPAPQAAYLQAVSNSDPRVSLMARMATELGMRRAEIARAHLRHLSQDADGWWLEIRGKGDKLRSLPVPDDLAGLIHEHTTGGYLFPGQIDGHLSADRVGVLLSKALPAGVSAHALRHKFATDAYDATTNLLAVQTLLGHADATTTRRYVQIGDNALRATVMAGSASRRQFS